MTAPRPPAANCPQPPCGIEIVDDAISASDEVRYQNEPARALLANDVGPRVEKDRLSMALVQLGQDVGDNPFTAYFFGDLSLTEAPAAVRRGHMRAQSSSLFAFYSRGTSRETNGWVARSISYALFRCKAPWGWDRSSGGLQGPASNRGEKHHPGQAG